MPVLCLVCVWGIVSFSLWLAFHFLSSVLKIKSFNLDGVQCIICFLLSFVLGVLSKKLLLVLGPHKLSLTVSLCVFTGQHSHDYLFNLKLTFYRWGQLLTTGY